MIFDAQVMFLGYLPIIFSMKQCNIILIETETVYIKNIIIGVEENFKNKKSFLEEI